MNAYRIDITTASDGTSTDYSRAVSGIGKVYAVQLVDGDFADGVDLTLTAEHSDLSIPVLVSANWNTDQMVYPRVAEALNTDASALSSHAMPLAFGRFKAVTAQGGATKTGAVIVYVDED